MYSGTIHYFTAFNEYSSISGVFQVYSCVFWRTPVISPYSPIGYTATEYTSSEYSVKYTGIHIRILFENTIHPNTHEYTIAIHQEYTVANAILHSRIWLAQTYKLHSYMPSYELHILRFRVMCARVAVHTNVRCTRATANSAATCIQPSVLQASVNTAMARVQATTHSPPHLTSAM